MAVVFFQFGSCFGFEFCCFCTVQVFSVLFPFIYLSLVLCFLRLSSIYFGGWLLLAFPMGIFLPSNCCFCVFFLPGGELVIPVLVEDPIDIPSVSTRSPFIPLPPTLRPVLTIIETTKESLAMATEAGVPCLSDREAAMIVMMMAW